MSQSPSHSLSSLHISASVSYNKNAPIGIFDSGIGGLSVAKAINELLPQEQIIYFGDTAHFPYGDKEKSSIQAYSLAITRFLVENGCKAIVIACNTASAASNKILQKALRSPFILIDVIDPVAHYVAQGYQNKKIGVIATKGTTASRSYPNSIKKKNPSLTTASVATPLLAPMIEEGFFNNKISQSIVDAYLSKPNLKHIEALILGCTHYPIIEKEINTYYKKQQQKVEIINGAHIVAQALQHQLIETQLLANQTPPQPIFYVSDFTPYFQKSSEIFFGSEVALQKKSLW